MMDIAELTRQCIAEEEANLVSFVKKDSLMDVFRKNFDLWENELFPLLRMLKKNRYDFICRILGEAGYEVSSEQVGLYLTKVRGERGTKKIYREKKNG